MPRPIQKYHAAVRPIANTLLVVLVMIGLALPKSFSRSHEVACHSGEACAAAVPVDLADLLPADDCPLDEWPTDCGDCGGHDHKKSGDHSPLLSPHPEDGDGDGGKCPHHHHHHHQCVCTSANAWLISDADKFSLHPPLQGRPLARPAREIAPESPVFLLDRPPMA